MANTIILKKSSVAGNVPSASSLQPGELAINLADAKLYSKRADGTVISVGASGTGSMDYPSAGIAVSTGTGWAGSLSAPSGSLVGTTDTQTLTNKEITQRVSSQVSSTSPLAWNSDSFDAYVITAQASDLTLGVDAGAPVDGRRVIFRLRDNGTARALVWPGSGTNTNGFRAVGVTLPTVTTPNKTLYVGCIYNAAVAAWDVIAVAQEG